MRTIIYGSEYMRLHDDGQIERAHVSPSGDWLVKGAVRYNNFGSVVETKSLADILAGLIQDWQYKNGKQKWHVVDVDHGTQRIWTNTHSIR